MPTDKPTCILCQTPLGPWLPGVPDRRSVERFDLLRCADCGLGVIDPIPVERGRPAGPDVGGERRRLTARYRGWRRLRLVRRHVAGVGRLLDVGCGEGDFVASAVGAGWRAAGVERGVSRAAAARAGLALHASLDELRGLGTFDVVTLWHSYERMTDPLGELDRIVELLSDGGTLFLVVPDAGGIQARLFGRRWFHLDVPRHVFHYDPSVLARVLASRGLVVVGVDRPEVEEDLLGWLQSAQNVLLPTPNLLFDCLRGEPVVRRGELAAALLLAVLLLPLAVLATAGSVVVRRGAIVGVVARKPAFARLAPLARVPARVGLGAVSAS
jgi:hypothetical protein